MVTCEELHRKYGEEEVCVISDVQLRMFENIDYETFKYYMTHAKRYLAENDATLRQVVSYVIIENPEHNEYFVSVRKNGDDRLLYKLSCIGGHMDATDESVRACAIREMREELTLRKYPNLEYVTNIYLNETEVDKCHIGIVYRAIMSPQDVEIAEKANLDGVWLSYAQLVNRYDYCESWLKWLIDNKYIRPGNFERSVSDAWKNLLDVYTKKNADYGNSFYESYKLFGITSPFVRMYDKASRIKSLGIGNKRYGRVEDEPVFDTLLDLANYCVMTACAVSLSSGATSEDHSDAVKERLRDLQNEFTEYDDMNMFDDHEHPVAPQVQIMTAYYLTDPREMCDYIIEIAKKCVNTVIRMQEKCVEHSGGDESDR